MNRRDSFKSVASLLFGAICPSVHKTEKSIYAWRAYDGPKISCPITISELLDLGKRNPYHRFRHFPFTKDGSHES